MNRHSTNSDASQIPVFTYSSIFCTLYLVALRFLYPSPDNSVTRQEHVTCVYKYHAQNLYSTCTCNRMTLDEIPNSIDEKTWTFFTGKARNVGGNMKSENTRLQRHGRVFQDMLEVKSHCGTLIHFSLPKLFPTTSFEVDDVI